MSLSACRPERVHARFVPLLTLVVALALAAPPLAAQLSIIRQGKESRGALEANDRFGAAVAAGDFDGDGLDDLATGSPYERVSSDPFALLGAVIISYGSTYGLTWDGADLLTPLDAGYDPDLPARFGHALAVGDFDADGFDDLAVGAPYATAHGQPSAGLVFVYEGSPGGLSTTASLVLDQADVGALVESGDNFGWAVAAGTVGDDTLYADLVIGSIGENANQGAVTLLQGGPSGLAPAGADSIAFSQISPSASSGDAFGYALAVGRFYGFSSTDVMVGAPFDDVSGAPDAGTVHVIQGGSSGWTTAAPQSFDSSAAGIPVQNLGDFGASLATGDFFELSSIHDDVAIGYPGYDQDSGAVVVAQGGTFAMDFSHVVEPGDVGTAPESGDRFGHAVAAGRWNVDLIDDLAVGSPGETVGSTVSGLVHVISGGPDGPGFHDEIWYDLTDLGDTLEDAELGWALAFGHFSTSGDESVVAGAPKKDNQTGQVHDIAPWRQVLGLSCQTSIAADCAGRIVFAQKPFERVKIASTTKIMTLLLACEATQLPPTDPDYVDLDEVLTIDPWVLDGFPLASQCSNADYWAGEMLSYESVLRMITMQSANDGCYVVADRLTGSNVTDWTGHTSTVPAFVSQMNARALALGMFDTNFTNPAGVDPGDPFSSAFDMLLLTQEAMQNPLFQELVSTPSVTLFRDIPWPFDPSGFLTITDTLSYGYLQGIQAVIPTAIGVKDGNTPGAGRTGVYAARQPDQPWNEVYAAGFGWANGTQRRDQGADLLRVGFAGCNSAIFEPGQGLNVGWGLVQDLPFSEGVVAALDLTLDGVPTDAAVVCIDGVEFLLADLPTARVDLDYRVSFELDPGMSETVGLSWFEGHQGFVLRNQDPVLPIDLLVTTNHPPASQAWTLLPNEMISFDPVGVANDEYELTIENLGATRAAPVGLEITFDMDVSPTPIQPTTTRSLVRSGRGYSEQLRVLWQGATPGSAAQARLSVAGASEPFVFAPCEARWNNYGVGWPGALGVPPHVASAPPLMDSGFDIFLGTSSPVSSSGFFVLGIDPAYLPSNKDGILHLDPLVWLPVPIPAGGVSVPVDLGIDPALCGASLYSQVIVRDPAASKGWAFSRGLELTLGDH